MNAWQVFIAASISIACISLADLLIERVSTFSKLLMHITRLPSRIHACLLSPTRTHFPWSLNSPGILILRNHIWILLFSSLYFVRTHAVLVWWVHPFWVLGIFPCLAVSLLELATSNWMAKKTTKLTIGIWESVGTKWASPVGERHECCGSLLCCCFGGFVCLSKDSFQVLGCGSMLK